MVHLDAELRDYGAMAQAEEAQTRLQEQGKWRRLATTGNATGGHTPPAVLALVGDADADAGCCIPLLLVARPKSRRRGCLYTFQTLPRAPKVYNSPHHGPNRLATRAKGIQNPAPVVVAVEFGHTSALPESKTL